MKQQVRLNKKQESINNKIETFALRHASLILLLLLFVVGILFVLICYVVVGVSSTESGLMRNFINGGI